MDQRLFKRNRSGSRGKTDDKMINWLFSFISILGVNKNFTHYKLLTKKKKMTWQLMWRNVRVAALNATLQLLVI